MKRSITASSRAPAHTEVGAPLAPPAAVSARELGALGLATLLCGVIFVVATDRLANPDTFFHLRFGHEFLDGWPISNPGSVNTYATNDWTPTQWLSQMAMATVENRFGLAGVAWLAGVLYLSYAISLYVYCRREASALTAIAVTFLAFLASSPGISARPQMVSLLLVSVTVGSWLATARDGRPRWWLIPMLWLWCTMHGLWFVGVGLCALAAATLVFGSPRAPRRILLIPGLSAFVVLLTPLGFGIYSGVLRVGEQAQFYTEFDPPNIRDPAVALVTLLLLAVLALGLRKREPLTSLEIVLLVIAVLMASYSLRTVPLAAAVVAPLLARQLPARPLSRPSISRAERGLTAGLALSSATALALLAPAAPGGTIATADRVNAELDSLPAGTPLMGEDTWGGYLMWRHPQLDLVAHGYADCYRISELQGLINLYTLQPGWDVEFDALDVDLALLSPDSPLSYALEEDMGWVVVQRSKGVVLLRDPDSAIA